MKKAIIFVIIFLIFSSVVFDIAMAEETRIFDNEVILKIEPNSIQIPKHQDLTSQVTISGWVNGTGSAKINITGPDLLFFFNQTSPLSKDGKFYAAYVIDQNNPIGKYHVDLIFGEKKIGADFVVWDDQENVISINQGASKEYCEIDKTCFDPSYYVADIGKTVIWQNLDSAVHTVTSGEPSQQTKIFSSEPIIPGRTFSFTFDKLGNYHYFCRIHPWMEGEIVIEKIQPKDVYNNLTDTNGNPQAILDETPILSSQLTQAGFPKMGLTVNNQTLSQYEELLVTVSFPKFVSNRVYLSILGKDVSIRENVDVYGTESQYKLPISDRMTGQYRIVAQTQFGGDIQSQEIIVNVVKPIKADPKSPIPEANANEVKQIVENSTQITITTINIQNDENWPLYLGGIATVGAGYFVFRKFRNRRPFKAESVKSSVTIGDDSKPKTISWNNKNASENHGNPIEPANINEEESDF